MGVIFCIFACCGGLANFTLPDGESGFLGKYLLGGDSFEELHSNDQVDTGRKSPLMDFELNFGKITRKIMFENWTVLLSMTATGPYLENKKLYI